MKDSLQVEAHLEAVEQATFRAKGPAASPAPEVLIPSQATARNQAELLRLETPIFPISRLDVHQSHWSSNLCL